LYSPSAAILYPSAQPFQNHPALRQWASEKITYQGALLPEFLGLLYQMLGTIILQQVFDLSDEEASERLVALRGVGTWTAEMILIFALLRPDVFPIGDVGVVRAVEGLYNDGGGMSTEELVGRAEQWRPWRTVATWYLWRSIDPEPVQY
jgi:hypothetical protein